jgi:hypothetical protein
VNNSSLESINQVYQCASIYDVNRHRVTYDELGLFSIALNTFQSQIGELAEDPYWQKYFSELRRLRFGLCAAPVLNDYRDYRIDEIRTALAGHLRRCHAVYPTFAEPANDVLQALVAIQGDGRNPLLDKLVELRQPDLKSAWVIKESRLIPHVEDVLRDHPEFKPNLQIVHHSQLASATCYDQLVFIGSPTWFPPSVFTSPRAPRLDIVQFSWMRDSWKIPTTFVANYTPSQIKRVTLRELDAHYQAESPADTILLNVDIQRVASIAARGEHREYDEVDARCIVFEGETAIFVDADQSSTVLVIDLEERDIERVRSSKVGNLALGTFVLVRTSGGGDYILPIADQILGSKAQYARSVQSEWKTLLRQYVVEHGLLKTSIDLLDMGSNIANEMNVRNWMSPRNIKTRDEKDFAAVMRLIGLAEREREIWQTMELISSAHLSAGSQLRKRLLALVDAIPPDEFRKRGKIEFKLEDDDDDAKLTAYRVEDMLPGTYKVAYTQIGVPFKLGNN